jgi:hypothetical protein
MFTALQSYQYIKSWLERWILQQNSASPFPVEWFLAKKQILILEHPAYLPDLVLCAFFTFQKKTKKKKILPLKGSHFEKPEDSPSSTKGMCGQWFPTVFPSWEQVLECVYKVRRQLLWRWIQSIQVSDNTNFPFTKSIWLINCQILYINMTPSPFSRMPQFVWIFIKPWWWRKDKPWKDILHPEI